MAEYKAYTFSTPTYPTCLTKGTLQTPSTPLSPTQIQVRVKSAALNPVDIQIMNIPLFHLPYLNHPKGIGEDFSGIVFAAGADSGFAEGDEIFGCELTPGNGTLGDVLVVDAKTQVVLKKPEGWSWNQAAAMPLVWLTARSCIECVEPYVTSTKKTVVVLGGSSATGMYTIYLAAQRGWTVITSCSGRNADFVRTMGAAEVIDYTTSSVPSLVRAANPDAIIDCVGGTECLGIAKRYVTIVGDKTGRSTLGGSMLYLTSLWMVLRKALGMLGWGGVYDCINLTPSHEFLREALELPVEKILIDSTFGFGEVREAFERLNTGRARGKVVVEVEK